MKLSRIFLMAVLVGTLGVIGCGDSGSGGSDDPSELCNVDLCAASAALKTQCETAVGICLDEPNANRDECLVIISQICEA